MMLRELMSLPTPLLDREHLTRSISIGLGEDTPLMMVLKREPEDWNIGLLLFSGITDDSQSYSPVSTYLSLAP